MEGWSVYSSTQEETTNSVEIETSKIIIILPNTVFLQFLNLRF